MNRMTMIGRFLGFLGTIIGGNGSGVLKQGYQG